MALKVLDIDGVFHIFKTSSYFNIDNGYLYIFNDYPNNISAVFASGKWCFVKREEIKDKVTNFDYQSIDT
jgi:hypothetical protein